MPALDHSDRNIAFTKAMHGKSVEAQNSFMAMLNKNGFAHREITNEYVRRWNEKDSGKGDDARDERRSEYMGLVNK